MELLSEVFLRYALVSAVLAGGLCAFLGVYVMLKRIVFLGIALAETAALGVAIGLLIGLHPVISSFVLTVLVTLLFWIPVRSSSVSRESLIGYVYCLAGALSVILIAKNPMAESRGFDIVSGNLLYAGLSDLIIIASVSVFLIVLNMGFLRKFLFVSFDRETARAVGMPATFYDSLLYVSLGIAISVSMRTCGVLFVFGSLVIPPMAGLLFCRRVWKVFLVSVLVAVISAPVGLVASYYMDLPTAPAIICVEAGILILMFLLRRFAGR